LAVGVKVTVCGDAVWVVLLKVPVPDVIDQAAVVGPFEKPAPANVMGDGEAD
jgi:hypothetical protein